jgi:hypothetical protein
MQNGMYKHLYSATGMPHVQYIELHDDLLGAPLAVPQAASWALSCRTVQVPTVLEQMMGNVISLCMFYGSAGTVLHAAHLLLNA